MRNSKTLGVRISCKTWDSLTILSNFKGEKISEIVRQMLDAYTNQLLNRIPPDKLAEIKNQMEEK
jgi:Mg/Co/Ni transporter MgtE